MFIAVRAAKPQVAPQPLAVYLRQNMLAFETDVGAGAGPVLLDLAQLFGISEQNHAEFAKILHAHFEELRALVHRIPRDPNAGAAFRDAVYDALRASPSFTRDLLRNGALAFELGIGVPGQRFSIN